VDAAPIVGLFAGKHLTRPLAGNLLPVNVVEPRSRQPERGVVHAVSNVDQADIRKEFWDLERIEIGSCRHAATPRRPKPIIE